MQPEPPLTYRLTVNGQPRVVENARLTENLLYVLRERLGIYGPKNACEQGECGSCSVLLDTHLVCACCVLGADAAESDVLTVESLSADDAPTDLQRAFVDTGAVQCGFCTPGLIVTLHELLDRHPDADNLTVREAIAGNLCRCTGYGRIFEAVQRVQAERTRANA